jgi:hypothetical protein
VVREAPRCASSAGAVQMWCRCGPSRRTVLCVVGGAWHAPWPFAGEREWSRLRYCNVGGIGMAHPLGAWAPMLH